MDSMGSSVWAQIHFGVQQVPITVNFKHEPKYFRYIFGILYNLALQYCHQYCRFTKWSQILISQYTIVCLQHAPKFCQFTTWAHTLQHVTGFHIMSLNSMGLTTISLLDGPEYCRYVRVIGVFVISLYNISTKMSMLQYIIVSLYNFIVQHGPKYCQVRTWAGLPNERPGDQIPTRAKFVSRLLLHFCPQPTQLNTVH